MKINPRNLDGFLTREFIKYKALLFYGNNLGLIQQHIASISKNFFAAKEDASNVIRINYSSLAREPDLLLNEMRTLGLFGSKKIVIVSEVTGAIPEQLKKALSEESSPDVLIIFYGNQIAVKDPVQKFFELSQGFASVACYLEEAQSIERTALAAFKKAGIQIEGSELIKYVSSNVSGDSASIAAELDKLVSLHKSGDKLVMADMKAIISQSLTPADCDKYISFLMNRDCLSAEVELDRLILAGIKLTFIIKALSRYFMILYVAHGLIADGTPEDEVPSRLKPPIFFKNIPTFKLALKTYSVPKIIKALEQLLQVEIKVKTYDSSFAEIICKKELFGLFV